MTFECEGVGREIQFLAHDASDNLVLNDSRNFSQSFDKLFQPELLSETVFVRVLSHLSGNFSQYVIGIASVKSVNVSQLEPGFFEVVMGFTKGLKEEISLQFEPVPWFYWSRTNSSESEHSVRWQSVHFGRVLSFVAMTYYESNSGAPFRFQLANQLKIDFTSLLGEATNTSTTLSVVFSYFGFVSRVETSFGPEKVHLGQTFGSLKSFGDLTEAFSCLDNDFL